MKTGLAIFVNEGNIGGLAADVLAGFVYDWVTGANVLEGVQQEIG
ncbi:MAG TPA: hypothetical protein VEV87_04570 [Chitinophagaceae bacterium]|nr:hypothetical protein [Chitinophagaceae bacterium]